MTRRGRVRAATGPFPQKGQIPPPGEKKALESYDSEAFFLVFTINHYTDLFLFSRFSLVGFVPIRIRFYRYAKQPFIVITIDHMK